MKFLHFQKLPLIILVMFCLVTVAVAQNEDPVPSAAGTVKVQYDRFEDKTGVAVRAMVVLENREGINQLQLNIAGEYKGSLPSKPKQLVLIFGATTLLRQVGPTTLNVIADDKRFKFSLSVYKTGIASVYHYELVGAAISYDDWKQISFANKIEMRFDKIEFELTRDQRSTLQRFMSIFGEQISQ